MHTSAVIFAFGGNVLLATSFYVVQRTCRARLAGDLAPGSSCSAIISSSSSPAPATFSASPIPRNTPNPSGTRTSCWSPSGSPISPSSSHDRSAPSRHLCRELVLSRLYRHDRRAGAWQQRRDSRFDLLVEILHRLVRRPGRDDPMVVWPQRGRLLPDRRLSRHHVLFHPEAGRSADLFLSAVDHPLLGPIFLYIWAGPHHLHYTALPDWAQTLG